MLGLSFPSPEAGLPSFPGNAFACLPNPTGAGDLPQKASGPPPPNSQAGVAGGSSRLPPLSQLYKWVLAASAEWEVGSETSL